MTDELIAFLRARLDEDERLARSACKYASPEWHLDEEFGESVLWWAPEFHTRYEEDKHWRGQALDDQLAPHVAEWDPARVLREVEARRALVDAFAEVAHNYGRDDAEYADGWASGLGFTARQLASVYAEHGDYRDEWRP